MALSPSQIEIEISTLKTQMSQLLSRSTQPKDGVQATAVDNNALIPIQNPGEAVTFVTAIVFLKGILSSIGFTDINSDPPVGAYYFGEKAGIKEGRFTIGKIINQSPAVSDAHVSVFYEYLD